MNKSFSLQMVSEDICRPSLSSRWQTLKIDLRKFFQDNLSFRELFSALFFFSLRFFLLFIYHNCQIQNKIDIIERESRKFISLGLVSACTAVQRGDDRFFRKIVFGIGVRLDMKTIEESFEFRFMSRNTSTTERRLNESKREDGNRRSAQIHLPLQHQQM